MIHVLFDNNAYRDTARAMAQDSAFLSRLQSLERAAGLNVRTCPLVLMELLARASYDNVQGRKHAIAATSALLTHCTADDGTISHLADPETVICFLMFGAVPPSKQVSIQELGEIASRLCKGQPLESDADALFRIKAHVDSSEKRFVEDMVRTTSDVISHYTLDRDTNRERRRKLMNFVTSLRSPHGALLHGKAAALRACRQMGKSLPDATIEHWAKEIAGLFPAAIALAVDVMSRILLMNCDIRRKNRANWLWDIHILYSVASRADADGTLVRLVTSDEDMIAAARSVNSSGVIPYQEYVQDPAMVLSNR